MEVRRCGHGLRSSNGPVRDVRFREMHRNWKIVVLTDREVIALAKHENITEPDGMGFQVRVVRKGIERSK